MMLKYDQDADAAYVSVSGPIRDGPMSLTRMRCAKLSTLPFGQLGMEEAWVCCCRMAPFGRLSCHLKQSHQARRSSML